MVYLYDNMTHRVVKITIYDTPCVNVKNTTPYKCGYNLLQSSYLLNNLHNTAFLIDEINLPINYTLILALLTVGSNISD